jgi:hypothetical protein
MSDITVNPITEKMKTSILNRFDNITTDKETITKFSIYGYEINISIYYLILIGCLIIALIYLIYKYIFKNDDKNYVNLEKSQNREKQEIIEELSLYSSINKKK